MRSWENRSDCRVVDEPLYAYYLAVTGLDHPGRDKVIAAGETSWQAVVADLVAPVEGIYYQKHMAHHLLPQLPRDWIGSLTNLLLIRDPAEVVASYLRSRADVVRRQALGWRRLSTSVRAVRRCGALARPRPGPRSPRTRFRC